MDLVKELIEKMQTSCQRALDDYDKGDIQGLMLTLGDLDFIEHRLIAAKVIVRDELKELKKK